METATLIIHGMTPGAERAVPPASRPLPGSRTQRRMPTTGQEFHRGSRDPRTARPLRRALAVMFALAKQLPFALEHQARAAWAQEAFTGSRQPWLVNGRTLGIVGLGSIGQALAARASALGMSVVALRRQTDAPPVSGVSAVYGRDRLHEMLGQCDVLAIAAPLTPHTDRLIDRTALAALKPGAIVINVGRAAILDTDALVAALGRGHLGGASLDVFPEEPLPSGHPLWTAPNVLLTPHTSGFRQGHWDDVIEVFADNLERYRTGEPLRFEVTPAAGY